MKKAILFLSIIFIGAALHSYGQAGVLDPDFGTNGTSIQMIDSSSMEGKAIQDDGKVIVGGDIVHNGVLNLGLARFKADGSIDSTFGTNGVVAILAGDYWNMVTSVAIQSDGKIVFGGHCYMNSSSVPYGVLGRCKSDGSLDSSFADNGLKILDNNGVSDLVIRPNDGKILTVTSTGSPLTTVLQRFNTDGSDDVSFGINGSATDPSNGVNGAMIKMKLQPDNKIVGINTFGGAPYQYVRIARFNEDGTPDTNFGNAGIAVSDFGTGVNVFPNALTLTDSGKVLITGSYALNQPYKIFVARFNQDGALDGTFGTNGKSVTNVGNYGDEADAIAVQPSDNKIVIAGTSTATQLGHTRFIVGRLNANGALDSEFGTAGYVITDFIDQYHDNIASSVFVLPDGKILVGGTSSQLSSVYNIFARYNSCSIAVTNQPADQTVQAGTTASFTVGSTSPSATYQWQTMGNNGWEDISNGGQYSGVQTASLHIANVTSANNQQQFRSVAVSGVCTDTSDAATLTVTPGTGIDEIAAQTGVRLYPNPVSDRFTVEFHNPDYKVDQIRITDALGRVVETLKVSVNKTVTILSGSWPAGIYMVEVIPEKESPVTFRVIKQ